MSICLIDTSIFVEVLRVPNMASLEEFVSTKAALKTKIEGGVNLFLPMATVIETGNHIAQNGNGEQRRACAQRFVREVKKAYAGESPFSPISLHVFQHMAAWLDEFSDKAMQGVGIADCSIIKDYERMCSRHPRETVYIWTKDTHLSGYRQKR